MPSSSESSEASSGGRISMALKQVQLCSESLSPKFPVGKAISPFSPIFGPRGPGFLGSAGLPSNGLDAWMSLKKVVSGHQPLRDRRL
jgi:hypothetical protein